MKCKHCGVRWEIGNLSPVPDKCPVCDIEFASGLMSIETETIPELIYYLMKEQGDRILKDGNRICSYMDDIFPDKPAERSRWEDLLKRGLGAQIFKWQKHIPSVEEVDKYISKISSGEVQEDIINAVYFLAGVSTTAGDRFDNSAYYLQTYENSPDYIIKSKALRKASSLAADDEKRAILWKLVEIEEEKKDVALETTLTELMNLEDVQAILKLARHFETGEILAKDRERAFSLLYKYIECNDGEILYQIGRYYLLGWAGKNNLDKCRGIFREAAKSGNSKAMYQLYNMNKQEGLADEETMQYLIDSAKRGYIPAIHELAIHMLNGDGVEKNTSEAVKLLENNSQNGYQASTAKLRYLELSASTA